MSTLARTLTALAMLAGIALSTETAHANCFLSSSGTPKCQGIIESISIDVTSSTNTMALIDPHGVDTSGLTDKCDRQVNGTLAGVFVQMPLDTEQRRAAYSTLLAAYLAGKQVLLRMGITPTTACTVTAIQVLP